MAGERPDGGYRHAALLRRIHARHSRHFRAATPRPGPRAAPGRQLRRQARSRHGQSRRPQARFHDQRPTHRRRSTTWAPMAPSPTSTAIASTPSAIASSTSAPRRCPSPAPRSSPWCPIPTLLSSSPRPREWMGTIGYDGDTAISGELGKRAATGAGFGERLARRPAHRVLPDADGQRSAALAAAGADGRFLRHRRHRAHRGRLHPPRHRRDRISERARARAHQ